MGAGWSSGLIKRFAVGAMAVEFLLPARIKLPVLQEEVCRPDPAASTKGEVEG